MSDLQPRWYGVSRGNGNDGVSHTFPDYYVYTAHPFDLAEHDAIQQFYDEWQGWAAAHVEVDGESDHSIAATLFDGPDGQTHFGAAYLIVEVFPVDEDDALATLADPWGKPSYDGLTAALRTGEGIPPEPPYGVRARYPKEELVDE